MLKMFRFALPVLALTLLATAGRAQDTTGPTKFDRFIAHFDMGLQGTGVFTKSVTGTTYNGAQITQDGSNTFGGLFTLRGTKSPWVGAELNLGYARYTQSYSCCQLQGGAQANAEEFTLGYVVHPDRTFFGAKPSFSAGSGSIAFVPTALGGQGLHTQARQVYYYSASADVPAFADFFAIRVGFRQQFYKAPDFGQNYLTIKKMTITSEPVIGFIFHF